MSLNFTYQGQKKTSDELKKELPVSAEYKAYRQRLDTLERAINRLESEKEELEVEREELLQEWGEDS